MQKISRASNQLRFKTPASSLSVWEESLPVGDGKVGALLQGGVKNERVMICDARAIFKGEVGVLPDITDKLKDVRNFMSSKNPVMAGITLKKAFENKKYTPVSFRSLPIADLVVNQSVQGSLSSYSRTLGMESEEVEVSFKVGQTKFTRNMFVAFDSDLIYYEIAKEGNSPIVVDLAMVCHDKNTCVFNGEISTPAENETQTLSSSLIGYEQEVAGMVYGVLGRVMVDTKAILQVSDNRLKIENAEKILIVMRTYVGRVKEKPIEKVKSELLALRQVSYEKAFKTHYSVFQKKAIKTELVAGKEKDMSIEDLIANFNDDSTLIYEKLFNFGKYLFICGLSDDEFFQPSVSGLWGKHYDNPLAVARTSTSLPAIYSPAFQFGRSGRVKLLLDYYEKYQDDLKKSAYRVYKSKGYAVPETVVFGSGLPASIDPADISTITGGAVIANLYFEYFLYTKDLKFLKSTALPFMTSVADFYLNYFYRDEKGELKSCPSFAPDGKSKFFENKKIGVYENSACDFVVARTLISNIMTLANVYSVSVEKIVEYQNFLNSLPTTKTEHNAIKEYAGEENSVLSSGMMHLYNVFGTKEVQHNGNVISLAPYLNSLIFKVDKAVFAQNLISLGRLAQMSAILGQSVASTNIVKYLINNFLSKNFMFLNSDKSNYLAFVDGDNFFNIAGNMLYCTYIMQSMVLDYKNNISILPAKPICFKEGKLSGVETAQNVVVDVEFDDKRGNLIINLKALKSTKFNLILPKGVKKVKNYTIDSASPRIDNIMLSAGKSLTIDVKY